MCEYTLVQLDKLVIFQAKSFQVGEALEQQALQCGYVVKAEVDLSAIEDILAMDLNGTDIVVAQLRLVVFVEIQVDVVDRI